MEKPFKKIVTDKAPAALGLYSQGIVIKGNLCLIFVSGQLPIDPKTGELILGDIQTLTRQTLRNIEEILLESSSSLRHVVKTEVFLTDLKSDFNTMNEEYAKHFDPHTPPARQVIEVSKLPKNTPIVISCVAICMEK
jgi:2-iminobutanoate/2-iminopropanoate deaminase